MHSNILVVLLAAMSLQQGCGGPAVTSVSLDDQGATRAASVFAALEEKPAADDETSYHLAIAATEPLADGVVLCLGSQSVCATGQGTRIATTTIDVGGRRRHVSTERLKVQGDLIVTVLGRSTAGADVAKQFRFESTSDDTRSCYKAPDELTCDVERHIARLTNEFRQRSGRGELTLDRKFSYVSRLWSAEQARRGNIGHDWFSNGRWRQEYVKEFNEQPPLGGENVAMTGGAGGGAEAVAAVFVDMWINSSGHRANMLGGYDTIGVGVARQGSSWYATQNFGN